MAKKGTRKHSGKKKPAVKKLSVVEKPLEAKQDLVQPVNQGPVLQPMVRLRANITEHGYRCLTIPNYQVDTALEKIWSIGFKEPLNNRQRTHRVYGPHTITHIDVEPIL